MPRLAPTPTTLRALFARSGNKCAFPGCTQELITKRNKFVAQVCHIEAAEPNGERYNPTSTDEKRRSIENLILLCYPHHIETNDVAEYPVERLKEMKQLHEDQSGIKDFKINEAALYQIEHEMDVYWNHIEKLNTFEHVAKELAFPIRPKSSPLEIFSDIWAAYFRIEELSELFHRYDSKLNIDIRNHLQKIGYDLTLFDAVPYPNNPFNDRLWEIHNMAFPNDLMDLSMSLSVAEIQYLQEYVKTHPGDSASIKRLEEAKTDLQMLADKVSYID